MRISCLQFCSNKNQLDNFLITKHLILRAIKQKTDLIITPENSSVFGLTKSDLMKNTLSMHKDFYVSEVRKLARKHKSFNSKKKSWGCWRL